MEKDPDTQNVLYIHDYPELEKRLQLRRVGQMTLFAGGADNMGLIAIEGSRPPDSVA